MSVVSCCFPAPPPVPSVRPRSPSPHVNDIKSIKSTHYSSPHVNDIKHKVNTIHLHKSWHSVHWWQLSTHITSKMKIYAPASALFTVSTILVYASIHVVSASEPALLRGSVSSKLVSSFLSLSVSCHLSTFRESSKLPIFNLLCNPSIWTLFGRAVINGLSLEKRRWDNAWSGMTAPIVNVTVAPASYAFVNFVV